MNEIEILEEKIFKLSELNHKLHSEYSEMQSDKLNIALEGLEALISNGDQTGIAEKTLKAIKELNSTKE